MPQSTVIAILAEYVEVGSYKTLSLLHSTFREVLTRRHSLKRHCLLVYSHSQLNQVCASLSLLQNVQHLQVLVTHKSLQLTQSAENAVAPNNEAPSRAELEQFVLDAISEVASVARLVSISVAWCDHTTQQDVIFIRTQRTLQQLRQSDLCTLKLAQIPSDNLAALSYVNLQPLSLLSQVLRVLLSRAPSIDTLEFRNRQPAWIDWLRAASTCMQLDMQDLVAIRNRCPGLRRLLGVRVTEGTVRVLETFGEASIKLTDVHIVHDNVNESAFRKFLETQKDLVNVHIENTRSYWRPTPVSLYQIAKSKLVNLQKFDVFGLPPLTGQIVEEEDLVGKIVSKMHTLRKVYIEDWEDYDFDKTFQLQRITYRYGPQLTWAAQLPWLAMHALRSFSVTRVVLADRDFDQLRSECPLLSSLKLKYCLLENDAVVAMSRLQKLAKLIIFDSLLKLSPRYSPFHIPQLRQLLIHANFFDPQQRSLLELVANAPNLARLTLIDWSPVKYKLDLTSVWLHDLNQLRWLTTNLHERHSVSAVTFDVSGFPLLERLCVIPRDCDPFGHFVRIVVKGGNKLAVYLSDTQHGLIVAFEQKVVQSRPWLHFARRYLTCSSS